MDKKKKQRLEQLVRQGIVPSSKLPILMQAMSNLHMGKQLMPKERDVLAKYMFNMTDIMLKDTTVFNRAKLHTQKTRYQTEETEVDSIDEKMIGGVDVVDGPEDEERMRHAAQTKAKRLSIKKRDKFRLLSPEVKKEKMKAGVEEQVLKMNEDYKAKFEAALKKFGVSNIRDLPADKKKEFFNHVDASHVAQNEEVEIEEDMQVKQAIGIASDKRYKGGNMTGAVSAIEKMRKGLSDHPQVKAVLKRQNEEVELTFEEMTPQQKADRQDMKKEEFILDEDDLVVVIDEEMTTGYRPDMGHAGTQGTVNLGGKEHSARKVPIKHYDEFKKKHPGSKVMFRGPRDGMGKEMHTRKDNANHFYIVHKKKMKEEVELTFEEMTPQQKADRLRLIAKKTDYVQSGAAANAAEKRAKADMKQKGAQRGMAPTKKDVTEQVAVIRKTIKEGSAKEKIEAYKELNQIIEQFKTTGEL